ncbi:MAG: hypothetical protein ACI3YC_04670 [Alloprevotella sp.]
MKRMIFVLCAFLALGVSANAQPGDKKKSKDKTESREQLQRRAEKMAERMKLDDATTAWFTPIFVEYSDTLRGAMRLARPQAEGKKESSLTDEEALQQIETQLKSDELQVNIKRTYLEKFKAKLTPKQLLMIFKRPAAPNGQNRPGAGRPGGQGFPGGGGFGGPGGGFGGGDF